VRRGVETAGGYKCAEESSIRQRGLYYRESEMIDDRYSDTNDNKCETEASRLDVIAWQKGLCCKIVRILGCRWAEWNAKNGGRREWRRV